MAKRLWELFYTFAKVGVMTFVGKNSKVSSLRLRTT